MTDPWGGVAQAAIKLAIDEVEKKFVHAAIDTVREEVVDKHIDNVLSLRKKYPLQNIDILSSNLANNANIPQAVRQQVGLFQAKLRAVIARVAPTIEEHNYKTCEEALAGLDLSYVEQKKVTALVEADKRIHVSFESLNVAAQVFAGLNDYIVQRIAD